MSRPAAALATPKIRRQNEARKRGAKIGCDRAGACGKTLVAAEAMHQAHTHTQHTHTHTHTHRAALVDTEALYEALAAKRILAAGLDVW